jgi:hypothetical protein
MRAHQVETWVLGIINRVKAGQPIEDSRVELKSEWITPEKAARRIAGHANAARGARILWVVGVGRRRGVVGANHEELADWWPRVRSHFDGLAPEISDYNVPVNGDTVVALLFETDRVPFVVKNPYFGKEGGGPVALEVPWREGTRVRSARRSDLLRLLSPLLRVPQVEVIGGNIEALKLDGSGEPVLRWMLKLTLYVTPYGDERVTIPFHRCQCKLWVSEEMGWRNADEFRLCPPRTQGWGSRPSQVLSETVAGTRDEVLIYGPGKVMLRAQVDTPPVTDVTDKGRAKVSLLPANVDTPVSFSVTMSRCAPDADTVYGWCLSSEAENF